MATILNDFLSKEQAAKELPKLRAAVDKMLADIPDLDAKIDKAKSEVERAQADLDASTIEGAHKEIPRLARVAERRLQAFKAAFNDTLDLLEAAEASVTAHEGDVRTVPCAVNQANSSAMSRSLGSWPPNVSVKLPSIVNNASAASASPALKAAK